MQGNRMLGIAIVAAVAGGGARALADSKGRDVGAVAEKIAGQAITIKEGDVVLLNGDAGDADLLENLALQVQKRGGHPLVVLTPTPKMAKRFWTDVPAKYDARAPEVFIRLASMIDVNISVSGDDVAPGSFADIPEERFTARRKSGKIVDDILNVRDVATVQLGNGLYPGPNNAASLGVPLAELTETFWRGVNTDYAKLAQTGKAFQTALAGAKELEITHPNGTHIKMRVEGRRTIVSDGVISDEERAKGGAASKSWLPAGEVFIAPVPGTAEGVIIDDHVSGGAAGKDVSGLTLTFKEGRLVSMTARSPMDSFQRQYDAAPAGKDLLSAVDFGINPSVKPGPKSKLESYVASGTVTYNLGDNTWADGDIDIGWGFTGHLPGTTVKLDGKVLIENGQIK